MPTLYIHAGTPKTGTTALQSFFDNNRTLLAERANIYYPKAGVNPLRGGAHHELLPLNQNLQRKLSREIADFCGHDVVISTERFWGRGFQDLQPASMQLLQQAFPGYEIKVIIYIRRLDDFFKSIFNQHTKYESPHTLPSYAEFFQEEYKAKNSWSLFMSERISTATGLVGKENLLLRVYDRSTLKDNDIVTDFFDLLGKKIPDGARPVTHTNPSLPDAALPFISKNFLPAIPQHPIREEIIEILRQAYAFPKGSGVGDDFLAEFGEEIDRIDTYIPGYKDLFSERKLSFSFPEVDVKDPQALFIAALLYKLLKQQQNPPIAPSSGKWRYTAPMRYIKQRVKALLNIIHPS